MAGHTPGPWKIFDGWGADKARPVIVDSIPDVDGKCIANCICHVATTNADALANARLIAAAPTLLAACQFAIANQDEIVGENVFRRIDDAVKAATGPSPER